MREAGAFAVFTRRGEFFVHWATFQPTSLLPIMTTRTPLDLPWNGPEDAELRQQLNEGISLQKIAAHFRRSENDIRGRANVLGIPLDQEGRKQRE
jgi:hypothetical protein